MANLTVRLLAGCALGLSVNAQLFGQTLTNPPLRIHSDTGDSTRAVQFQPSEIHLSKGSKTGIDSIALVGEVAEQGLYLIRVRMEAHASNAAHFHPDARVTTVLSGTVFYGVGEIADQAHAKAFGPGSVYFTPAGTSHFLIAGDEPVIYEEAGVGPSKSTQISAP